MTRVQHLYLHSQVELRDHRCLVLEYLQPLSLNKLNTYAYYAYFATTSPLFFFNDTATPEIYTLSLHDALPISSLVRVRGDGSVGFAGLTVASGFTNQGLIDLTDIDGGFGAALTVNSGTLTNLGTIQSRSDEHTSELQSPQHLAYRTLLVQQDHS